METDKVYVKVIIKSEADLPKGDRSMYFVGVKDNLHPEDLYEWFDYKNPVMANHQAEYWINTFGWYLEELHCQPCSGSIQYGPTKAGHPYLHNQNAKIVAH